MSSKKLQRLVSDLGNSTSPFVYEVTLNEDGMFIVLSEDSDGRIAQCNMSEIEVISINLPEARDLSFRGDDLFDDGEEIGHFFASEAQGDRVDLTYVGNFDGGVVVMATASRWADSLTPRVSNQYFLLSTRAYGLGEVVYPQERSCTAGLLPGTLMATPDGPRAIETLAPGDEILGVEGRRVRVKWIWRRTVAAMFHQVATRAPICLTAGALGGGMPERELRLTPDHAILLEGLLVEAGALVNNASIKRLPASATGDHYIVLSVETYGHDLVLAEGVLVETFVDEDSRWRFDNFNEYKMRFGADPPVEELDLPRVASSRQLPPHLRP